MTFAQFKVGAARRIMMALGPRFLDRLETAHSYADFRSSIVMLNDAEDEGCFVYAAREYGAVCSPGERELLKGILLLTDFAWVADEIAKDEAYANMTRCGGEFRKALAACVLNAGY